MGIEYGLVAGYLFAWGIKRAKPIGDKAGAIADKALQDALTRLETVVRNRLGNNEAIEDLDEETANAAADDSSAAPTALSEDTHDALVHSLKRAAKKNPDFATELADALTAVQAADPDAGTRGRSGDNISRDNTTSGPMSPIVTGDGTSLSFGDYHAAPAPPTTRAAGRQPAPSTDEENGRTVPGPTWPGTGHS